MQLPLMMERRNLLRSKYSTVAAIFFEMYQLLQRVVIELDPKFK
jgi:hypothetical protein